MVRWIELVPCSAEWPTAFRAAAEELLSVWGQEVVAVHHVGSTEVPGLQATPIIDLLADVRDIERIDAYDAEMLGRGYGPKGEAGIPRFLAFRDYLRAHPDEAQACGALKVELARRFPHDIEAHMAGKGGLIQELERKAQAWREGSAWPAPLGGSTTTRHKLPLPGRGSRSETRRSPVSGTRPDPHEPCTGQDTEMGAGLAEEDESEMQPVVLRPNAVPVYGLLSRIRAAGEDPGAQAGKRVLDCGAGGPVPPLAVFHQQGVGAWGIDLSSEQLTRAKAFCVQRRMGLHLHQADMRQIPFRDAAFDYVYEHFSMCHLTKADTAQTIQDMYRVLKPGGLCLLGVISEETWPTLGQEKDPGEFWIEEDGELVLHSVFADEEIEWLLTGWEIIQKEVRIQESRERVASLSPHEWMQRYETFCPACSPEEWQALYDQRTTLCRYAHKYFLLRKPTSGA